MKRESFSRFKDRDSKPDEQKAASSKSKIKAACEALQSKPFRGRVFYLDLPLNKRTQILENDIKSLGGTVERFFSKEIKYLVSSKPEARYAQRLLLDSPAPSPDSGVSSPHPSSRRDSHGYRGSSQGPTDTMTVSRGKSLVERVVKEQERIQMNGILANAVEWGVKVLHVDDVISYIDKKKSKLAVNAADPGLKGAAKIQPAERNTFQKHNAGRISRPFVKVEDSSRHYRPVYLPVSNMPVCNLRSAPPCSPFLMEENEKQKQKEQRSGGERGKRGRKDRRRGQEGREKRKGGYCECCVVKFDSLKAHLQSDLHQTFSKSEEYRVVDQVIAGLTCDLMNFSTHARRMKCSVSAPLLHEGSMLKVKQQMGSLEGDGNVEEFLLCDSTAQQRLSDHTREKPLTVRKRSRGQCELSYSHRDSVLDQSEVLENSQSKRGSFEWEFHSHSSVRKTKGTPLFSREQICASNTLESSTDRNTQVNRDALKAQQTSGKTVESISGRECFRTDGSEINTHSIQETQVENSAPWALVSTEPEGFNPSSSLQRKVRNVRPVRRKDTETQNIQPSKERESLISPQGENLSASVLDLWQLFQSSDSMQDEFKGF